MGTLLTCSCGSRYVRDAEHEGDCDLWLIDEFWAGFLAWDWDREILIPTHMYPKGHQSDYVDEEYQWLDDYLTQKDAADAYAGLTKEDEDILLTTDKFIEKMLQSNGEKTGDTWSKNADGMWEKTDPYHMGKTTITNMPGGNTYAQTGQYTSHWQDSDIGYDWSSYNLSDRHNATIVPLPDGEIQVQATSLCNSGKQPHVPDFALYLDSGWKPEGMAIMLPWQDFGLPRVSYAFADYAIKEAFIWAQGGAVVEIGCIGAHGRTGTVLACLAFLADEKMSAREACAYVRTAFCEHAIETRLQEWYVERFIAAHKGEPEPAKPVYVASTPAVVTSAPKAPLTPSFPSVGQTGDPAKPGRQKRARRSKRGGRRVQRSRVNNR